MTATIVSGLPSGPSLALEPGNEQRFAKPKFPKPLGFGSGS